MTTKPHTQANTERLPAVRKNDQLNIEMTPKREQKSSPEKPVLYIYPEQNLAPVSSKLLKLS